MRDGWIQSTFLPHHRGSGKPNFSLCLWKSTPPLLKCSLEAMSEGKQFCILWTQLQRSIMHHCWIFIRACTLTKRCSVLQNGASNQRPRPAFCRVVNWRYIAELLGFEPILLSLVLVKFHNAGNIPVVSIQLKKISQTVSVQHGLIAKTVCTANSWF